jgi:hypothetical protein
MGIEPKWEHVARRMESDAKKTCHPYALLRVRVLVQRGQPVLWTSPRLVGLWLRARTVLEAIGIHGAIR